MERLTEHEMNGDYVVLKNCSKTLCEPDCCECEVDKQALKKLKAYEDAEEQGLLARLPCKIGDVLYYRSRCVIKELIVMKMRILKHCTDVFTEDIEGEKYAFSSGAIGKTVFLTREEAEAALERMG